MKIRIILLCVTLFSVDGVFANSVGIFNVTPSNSDSCSGCHSGGSFSYTAAVSGLNSLSPSTSSSYTFSMSGSGASAGGFSLEVSGGTLVAGSGTKLSGTTDITHSTPDSSGAISWPFNWSAPSTVGVYTMSYCGNPVDGTGGTGGDGPFPCGSFNITVNSAPSAVNDSSVTHTEDGGNKTISPLTNDSAGGSGDTKTLVGYCLQGTANASCTNTSNGFSLGSPGSLSKSGNNIIYAPAGNYNGAFTFEYRMQDSFGLTSNAEVTVTVSAVSDTSPSPAADSIAVAEGATATTLVGGSSTVLNNDSGLTDTPVTVSTVSSPNYATSFTLNSDGTFSYQHNGSENFTDRFIYKVTDLDGQNSNATVSIAISKVSDTTPGAVIDSISLPEGGTKTTLVGGSSTVTNNDTGLSDTPITVSQFSAPSQAAAFTLNSDGTFSYQHNGSDVLSDSFIYRITDNDGQTSNATVSISVSNVNDQPAAVNDTLGSVAEDSGATSVNILSNDTDSDAGDTKQIIAFCSTATADVSCTSTSYVTGTEGSVALSAVSVNNQAVFTPVNDYNGAFSFKYKMQDTAGLTSTATASLTVTAQNDPPSAVADTPAAVNEDTTNNSLDVLANDTDVDLSREGDTRQIIALCSSATASATDCTANTYSDSNGAVSLSAVAVNNTALFTPTTNYNGPFSFKYKMQDSSGVMSMALVSITVLSVSDSTPVANIESINLNEGATATSLVGGAASVLTNDTGLTDTPITIVKLTDPTYAATFSFNTSDGTFSYQHDGSENFTDSFSYRITDLDGGTDTAVVSISVTPVSDATPVAVANTINVAEGGTATTVIEGGGQSSVLANDTGLLDAPSIVTIVTPPVFSSSFALNADGTFSYTHNGSENFTDAFTYRVTDNDGQTSDASVSIVISKVSDSTPTTSNDAITVAEGGTVTTIDGGATSVMTNDSGLLDTPVVVSLKTSPSQANSFNLSSTGTFSYQHNGGEVHSDSFVYTLTDNDGQSVDGTANITISNVNDAPVALSDHSFPNALEDSSNNLLNVLANDTDSDAGDTKRIVALCAKGTLDAACTGTSYTPASGALTLNAATANNQVVLNPALNANGLFEFKYKMQDTAGLPAYAEASVTVTAVNDAPVITSTSQTSVIELVQYQYQVTVTDPDDSGTGLQYSLIGAPSGMSVTLNGGLITWTPGQNTASTYNFSVQVEDGRENSASPAVEAIALTVSTADMDADTIADYDDNCPNTANTNQANNDGDSEGDLCDTDDDNDTMLDTYEIANGLDPFSAADAALDNDGDGLTNAQEAALGSNPNADTVPPVITASTINVNATGTLTAIEFAVTAADTLDGVINPTTTSSMGPFLSGQHTVSWRAVDKGGNIATLDQTINIAPIVSVAASQMSGEGRALSVTVLLSGSAAAYPVGIDYLISGSAAQPADHNLINGSVSIASGVEVTLPVTITNDVLVEGNEEIILTLSTASNATIGGQNKQTITIVEQQVPPSLSLSAVQNANTTVYIYKDQGIVSVTATASDANGDAISYDWTAVSNISFTPVPTTASATVQFDPSTLTAGLYNLPVSISDGTTSVSSTINLLIEGTAPILAGADSDGDGVDDITEGLGDKDSDGQPDYLDPIDQVSLINTVVSPLDNNYKNAMQTESGLSLKLGRSAIVAKATGTQVSLGDIEEANPGTILTDSGYTQISSLFDFEIHGLNSVKNTAKVVIPLPLRLPKNAVYRKYEVATGWSNFVEDSENTIKSANSNNGICPDVMNAAYVDGLQLLADCIELTISDGGPNDADGLVNGTIVDPGGISVPNSATPEKVTEANLAQVTASNASVSAGGSSAFNTIFLSLLVLMGLYLVMNKNKK